MTRAPKCTTGSYVAYNDVQIIGLGIAVESEERFDG